MTYDSNKDVLTETFSNLRNRFKRIALKILHGEEDAEDALQDAFCKLWTHCDKISSTAEAEALITTTVRNISIDSWRKQQHYQNVELDQNINDGLSVRTDINLEAKEKFRLVESIIDKQLTPLQKEILKRRDYDGDDYENIAKDLNMQQTAVRVQLSRARKTIRDLYRKIEE